MRKFNFYFHRNKSRNEIDSIDSQLDQHLTVMYFFVKLNGFNPLYRREEAERMIENEISIRVNTWLT